MRRPRAVVAEGLEAAKPFIAALCTAQQELADSAAKPTADYPVFPDYQDDVFYAVSSVATDELAKALTIAGKEERNDRTDEIKVEVLERSRPSSSPAARRRSAPRTGR